MIIKNNTVGVINIDNKHILPQQAVKVDDVNKKHPVIARMIKNGQLVEVAESVEKPEKEAEVATLEDFAAFMGIKPTPTRIKNFAKKHGIEMGDAKTEEEMVAVIKACLTTAE